MALYGVRLVINLFDLCIYRRYLEEFIGNRKTSMEFSVLLLIVCELIGSAVNQMGISWLNFVTMVAILCVYVCQYEAGIAMFFASTNYLKMQRHFPKVAAGNSSKLHKLPEAC